MAIVHDPSLPISGVLTDSASGSDNIYEHGANYAPLGRKINSQSLGINEEKKWGAEDANLLGHVVTDIVNLGTVPLFLSASSVQSTASLLEAWVTASGARYDAASATFSATRVSYLGTSASIGVWPSTGTYPGPFAADLSGGVTSISGILMYALYKASSSLGTALGLQGTIIDIQNSSSNFSQSLYGVGTPGYTGALGPWASGVMQELTNLSSSYFGTNLPNYLNVSGSVVALIYTLFGTKDTAFVAPGTGSWTGSYPTATFNSLRVDHYVLSASYYNTSASYWPLSAAYSATKLMTDALSASYNLSASKWDAVSSSYYVLSGNYYTSASQWIRVNATSSADRFVLSGANGLVYVATSGGNFGFNAPPDAAGLTVQEVTQFGKPRVALLGKNGLTTGSYMILSVADIAEPNHKNASILLQGYDVPNTGTPTLTVAAGIADVNNSGSSEIVAQGGGLLIQGASVPVTVYSSDLTGQVILSATNARVLLTASGLMSLSATVVSVSASSSTFYGITNVSGPNVSSTHDFGNGTLNVSGGWDGVHIMVGTGNGANNLEMWNASGMQGYWSEVGDIVTSGTIATAGIVRSSGGFDAGASKVFNMATGTVSTDAVTYGQFQPVSSTLVSNSQSLSGVLNSSSLSTPTAIYLKAPNGNIYRIEVDNSGVLSSTLV